MPFWNTLRGLLRRGIPPLVEAEAQDLIREHGAQAYGVAQWRARQIRHGALVDDSWPAGHWHAVSRWLANLVGHQIGADNATRRLDDH